MLKRLLLLKAFPANLDAGLLALRLIAVTSLLIKHGLEKTVGFAQMYPMALKFHMDPIGIGVLPSLLYAAFADGICTVLIILGVATRWAALFSFINLSVAWAFVHHFSYKGQQGDHGELMVAYLAVMLTLILAGPGKYSVDEQLLDR